MPSSWKSYLRQLGPGFITGVSDDDPSGIATYSQAGTQFGTAMIWVPLFSFPLMAAIQEISARIGRVTGRGLAGNLRKHYPPWILYMVVALTAVSNIINIGADIAAMSAAIELVVGKDRWHLLPILINLFSVVALTILPYATYSSLLKWLGLSVFTYVGIAFFVHIPWRQVVHDMLVPTIHFDDAYLTMLVAVLGTTISPYLFFWQSSVEVEEQKADPQEQPVREAPEQARSQFMKIRFDTYSGMAVANLVMFFIILTTAFTLHANHVTHIESAEQAARALEPIAGRYAFLLFAAGIVGTGLLAVPTLGGSVGYALGEALKWRTGLDRKLHQAPGFYTAIALSTLLGAALNFTHIDPIKALIWSAVINGLVSVPLLCVLMLIARNHTIMGKFVIPSKLSIAGWFTTAIMAAAAVLTLCHLFAGSQGQ